MNSLIQREFFFVDQRRILREELTEVEKLSTGATSVVEILPSQLAIGRVNDMRQIFS